MISLIEFWRIELYLWMEFMLVFSMEEVQLASNNDTIFLGGERLG